MLVWVIDLTAKSEADPACVFKIKLHHKINWLFFGGGTLVLLGAIGAKAPAPFKVMFIFYEFVSSEFGVCFGNRITLLFIRPLFQCGLYFKTLLSTYATDLNFIAWATFGDGI